MRAISDVMYSIHIHPIFVTQVLTDKYFLIIDIGNQAGKNATLFFKTKDSSLIEQVVVLDTISYLEIFRESLLK